MSKWQADFTNTTHSKEAYLVKVSDLSAAEKELLLRRFQLRESTTETTVCGHLLINTIWYRNIVVIPMTFNTSNYEEEEVT